MWSQHQIQLPITSNQTLRVRLEYGYMNYVDVNDKPGSRFSHVRVMAITMFSHCILIMKVLSIQLVISGVIVTDDTVVLPGVIINNDSIILPGVEIDNVQA